MSKARIDLYIPVIREFTARVLLFHESVAQQLGLHATDVKALRALGDDALTAGVLAEKTGITGAAATALVDRLEAAGYVTRERDEDDRRRVTIRAVPGKMRKIDRLYESQGTEMARILATYSASEFAVIMDFLNASTQLLEAQLRGRL